MSLFSKNFKVRSHVWENGNLSVNDIFFQTIEDAMSYVDSAEGDTHKIFNIMGQIVHERKKHHHHFNQFY